MINVQDDYEAFCFNEACLNLMLRLQNDEKPMYIENREQNSPKQYTSFEDYYKSIE